MKIRHLDEPELQFGTSRHIDIKFGIMNYGVLDFDVEESPRKIHLAIVGVNEEIETFLEWIESCSHTIDAKESKKTNLFPQFPGFAKDQGFYSEIITEDRIHGIINSKSFDNLNELQIDKRIEQAVDIFIDQIEYLVSKNHKIDVILCAVPKVLIKILSTFLISDDEVEETKNVKSKIDFRRLLKSKSLKYRKPLQIILPSTYDPSVKRKTRIGTNADGSLQDEATRAWNFFTALYYKAGGIPWRLIRKDEDFQTCYIGVSFYRSLDEQTIQTSVAQVFNERGQGIIIRGGAAKTSKHDKQIHLESDGAKSLILIAIKKYSQEHKTRPARVVIHKTSDFNEDEIKGFVQAIKEERIELFDFISLSKSFTRLHRKGKYPPLRGTFWELDDENKILYTKGSVDFFQTYPGLYIPKTLKMKIAYTDQSPRHLAEEILALSKMNWNNAQLDNSLPITIQAARQVGEILKYVKVGDYVEPSYCFYM